MSDIVWHIGDRVRLIKPDNPHHPRVGQVGEVVDLNNYPADPGWPKRGKPARTLLWTRFRRAGWDDWRERKMSDETFGLFDHEVEAGP